MQDRIADRTERFLEHYAALRRRFRWEDATTLRYVALGLSFLPDPSDRVVARLGEVAAAIRDRSSLFSELRGSIRYPLAAMLLRRGGSVDAALATVDRHRREIRGHRIGRGGGIYPTLAAFLLLGTRHDHRPRPDSLERADALFARMAKRHRFLTDRSDVPMTVALAMGTGSIPEIDERMEGIYRGLVAAGCGRSNATQLAAEILTLGECDASEACAKFVRWRGELRSAGLPWRSGAYDETALLALLPDRSLRVDALAATTEHVYRHGGFWSRFTMTRGLAFSLATGLHLGALSDGDPALCKSLTSGMLAAVQQAIEAQQAAVVAACVAASVAATSASSS